MNMLQEPPINFIEKMLSTKMMRYDNHHLLLFEKSGLMLNMRLFVQLMKHFIDNEPALLENTMYESIASLVNDYEQRGGNVNDFMTMSENVIAATGLGLVNAEINKLGAIAVLEINPFAEEYLKLYGTNTLPICHLYKGALRMLFDKAFKSKGKITEAECIGQGKKRCIFKYDVT